MRLPLRSPVLRPIAFLIALAPVLLLTAETLRVSAAATLAQSQDTKKVRWSMRIDPGNPRLIQRLGMTSYWEAVALVATESRQSADSIELLKKTLQLDPHQTSYWWDLATVCDALQHQECAGPAFERALALSPMRPQLHWRAANYYLRAGQTDAALTHFRDLLGLDRSYARDTFYICVRLTEDPQVLAEKLFAGHQSPELMMMYVDALMQAGQPDTAYQLWTRNLSHAFHLPFTSAQAFVDGLIDSGRIEAANSVWLDLAKNGIVTHAENESRDNAIYNGDFEQVPLNAGFDWRYSPTHYVFLDFEDSSAHQGSRCLRLEFTLSRNEEYEPVYQLVSVLPGRRYLLSAYVRSADITSDSGPRLRVTDSGCTSCLNVSDDGTVGTSPWHPVNLSFSSGSATRLVKVSIWRPLARTYPMTITGSFWIDSVSLTAVEGETTKSAVSASNPLTRRLRATLSPWERE